jgi:hypothetical protein
MAHRIEIPVEFRFEVESAIWRVALARPVGWSTAIMGGPVFEVIEPSSFRGMRKTISEEHLPELSNEMKTYAERYQPWPLIWNLGSDKKREALSQEIERAFGDIKIELLLCDYPDRSMAEMFESLGLGNIDIPAHAEKIDAWTLRDEFLRVKRNLPDLVRFLNRWGTWSWDTRYSRTGLLGDEGKWEPSFVFADPIWFYQDSIKNALQGDPSVWLSHSRLGGFSTKDKFPYFEYRTSTCKEAIEATITFDLVQGTKFRLCALKDCRVPFKLESGHKRRFCMQYHAHLASVRRTRKQHFRHRESTDKSD